MSFAPFTGCKFIHFGQGWINVDGAHNFAKSQTMFHCQYIFAQHITGMISDDRHTQNFVFASRRNHLNNTVSGLVCQGSIKSRDIVVRHFKINTQLFRFRLVDANSGNFRRGKRRPRHHRIVHFEFLETAEQRVYSSKPSHM